MQSVKRIRLVILKSQFHCLEKLPRFFAPQWHHKWSHDEAWSRISQRKCLEPIKSVKVWMIGNLCIQSYWKKRVDRVGLVTHHYAKLKALKLQRYNLKVIIFAVLCIKQLQASSVFVMLVLFLRVYFLLTGEHRNQNCRCSVLLLVRIG